MPNSSSDATLAALLAEAPFLNRLARGLCRSAADADDLVQETWTEVLAKGPRHAGSPRGFLATILRHRIADRRRAGARRARREREAARPEAQPPDPGQAERFESQALLLEAVRSLPEDQAHVVALRYYDDLTPAQIAKRLGVPASSVRSTLARGLARLRERMDSDTPGGRERWMAALGTLLPAPVPAATGLAAALVMKKSVVVVVALAALVLGGLWFSQGGAVRPGGSGAGAGLGSFAGFTPAAELPLTAVEPVAVEPAETERATVAAPAREASLDVRVFHRDGTRGVGVRMLLSARDPELSREQRWSATVGADGVARFTGLPSGPVSLVADRDRGGEELTLEPGERRELRYDLSAVGWVRGRVLDSTGAAVEGAEICLLPAAAGPNASFPVAFSGPDGGFELMDLTGPCGVSARAAGFGPSAVVKFEDMVRIPLDPEVGSAADFGRGVELRLSESPGRIRGRVVGADGEPLAGVPVWVSAKARAGQDFDWAYETDGSGGFDTGWTCGPGLFVVHALSPGCAVESEQLELAAGAEEEIELQVAPGAALTGRVLDADGAPLAGAVIAFGEQPLDGYIEMTHWVRQDVPAPEATTDAEGRYRLGGLPAGEQRIQAKGATDRDGRAELRVDLEPGGTYAVDIQLDRGLTIRGRVVDLGGQPVEGAIVRGVKDRAQWEEVSDRTDAGGEFLLTSLRETLYRVEVRSRDFVTLLDAADGVSPGDGMLEFQVDMGEQYAGEVSGWLPVWVLEDLWPVSLSMWLEGDSLGNYAELDDQTGEFRWAAAGSGVYRLQVVADGRTLFEQGGIELGGGSKVDLGELAIERWGRVELALPEDATDRARLWLSTSDGRQGSSFDIDGRVAVAERVLPGDWRLGGEWPGRWVEPVEVRVGGGEQVSAELTLRESYRVYLALLQPGAPAPADTRVIARGPLGEGAAAGALGERELERIKNRPDGAAMFLGELPRGAFELRFECPAEGGLQVLLEGELQVDGPVVPEAMPEFGPLE